MFAFDFIKLAKLIAGPFFFWFSRNEPTELNFTIYIRREG
jgi:hypothetical protein